MTDFKVSVAMCTYNGEKFLSEQLVSILSQTHSNIEVVICDDGSSDGTVEILQKFASSDPRIKLHINQENLGFIKNFEKALGLCEGNFIALSDQDDIWFDNKITVLLDSIGENSMVYSSVQLVDENGRLLDAVFPDVRRLQGRCGLALLLGNCVTGHACMVRRDFLDVALPIPDGIKAHDQWLAIIASLSGGLKAESQILSNYRQHADNVMLNNKKNRENARWIKKRNSDELLLRLCHAVSESGLLDRNELALVTDLELLIRNNRHTFYNRKLKQFLLQHRDTFLALYQNQERAEKVASRLSRGDNLLKYLPFI